MARKYTKATLEAAAVDFNKVLGFDVPIATGNDTTAGQLVVDITDIVNNHLLVTDEVSEETVKLVGLMGLEMPVEEVSDEEVEEEIVSRNGEGEEVATEVIVEVVVPVVEEVVEETVVELESLEVDVVVKEAVKAKDVTNAGTKGKGKGVSKGAGTKAVKNKNKDEFGFTIGTKNNLFVEAIKTKPMTMAEIKKAEWNKSNGTFYQLWKTIEASGKGKKDGKAMIIDMK